MKHKLLYFTICLFLTGTLWAQSQKKTSLFKGMYFQWGYNKETYTKSSLHFSLYNGDKFVVHNVVAHDKPDFDGIINAPLEISIPQYNYRIGFYLNKEKTKALELNFDHIKYVVTDYQTARVTGILNGKSVDADMVLDPQTFFHLEHTDGGNLLHINYVQIHNWKQKKNGLAALAGIWKAGAGINIPRTDVTWKGDRFNNQFHIAGYNLSVEAGARWYFANKVFLEATAKTGFVHYVNALANTETQKGNKVAHALGYAEAIVTIGFDINWSK